jgi:hypothetical protein
MSRGNLAMSGVDAAGECSQAQVPDGDGDNQMTTGSTTSCVRAGCWVAAVAAMLLCGCTHVEPWERGDLAKPHVGFEHEATQRALREHTYMSREAAQGGEGSGGGGCGCY